MLRLGRRDIDLVAPEAADRLAERLRPDDVLVAVSALAPCRNSEMLRDNMIMAAAMIRAAAAVPPAATEITVRVGKGGRDRHTVLPAQIVNISSDAVYADAPVPLREDSVRAPESLHGAMHLARELMFAAEVKTPLAILRPSLLYGAADPHNGYGPNRFRRLAAAGEPIVLFGNGEERRDHVLIDDVAEVAARVIYRRSAGALNIATGAVASFRAIAEIVVRLSGRPVPIRPTPRTGPMPHNGYRPFDPAACYAAFPDFRYVPLPEGLAKLQAEA